MIEGGELVSFDTDLIGPYGYCADVSRAFHCGPGRPTDEQRRLFGMAMEQLDKNFNVIRPGMSFKEFAELSYQLPEDTVPNRYSVIAHGVGMCDEWPSLVYAEDMDRDGYDGIVEVGMTLCLESYIGRLGGDEGVKLEQQVLITENGPLQLCEYPLEEVFYGG